MTTSTSINAWLYGPVGLGVCSACSAPGAFWYPPLEVFLPGVWMCDSCVHPALVWERLDRWRRRW